MAGLRPLPLPTALAAALLSAAAAAAPHIPQNDAVVLERLPMKATDPVARELRELRARLAAQPGDRETAVTLARRYFRLALAEGDPRYIGYAEAALRPWSGVERAPADVLFARALLSQYRHDFAPALADLAAAAAQDPDDVEVWDWQVAIYLVQADYEAVRAACAKPPASASPLDRLSCQASLDAMTGNARRAYDALSTAFAAAKDMQTGERLWILTRLAEFALRLGDTARAERHFKEAFALGRNDQYLLATYADFLLDERRAAEVVALLKDWVRADPLLLRLALAEKMTGAAALGEHIDALDKRFAAAAQRGEQLHQADEARFRLEFRRDARRAVALAQEDWKRQREPRDARILLEAALAANDPVAARPALEWLAASRHEDPTIQRLAQALRRAAK